MSSAHAAEIAAGQRFAFGANWARFLDQLDTARIQAAEDSLRRLLGVAHLQGLRMLDVGCGSGLFSLAARRLGARVHSFDYDLQSVACTLELRRRYRPDDPDWQVESGSVLDSAYLQGLGQWDLVYAWGVLHHSGDLARAMANVVGLVAADGRLFIAIYNDQGRASRTWLRVKRAYNRLPSGLRWLVLTPAALRLWGPTMIRDLLAGRPLHSWRHYARTSTRGMSPWRDVVDWVGGLPFEVATPEEVFRFYRDRGFRLEELTTSGGLGCNEFVFRRD
ncbi:MAG: class I SAM-dependent methyltransferase [Chromatiaceae bacterium]|nr:MAG: class I SAM-dependent methyltransferase [Chromatiaceae bacterium]